MHAFVISMPQDSIRRRSAITKIKAARIPFEIVDGVEGKKWRSEELRAVSVPDCKLKPAEIGCYLAHLRTLQRIVEYGLPWAIVLEDDFCYEADPDFGLAEIEKYLSFDFDYIHLQKDWGWNPWLKTSHHSSWFERMDGTPLGTTGYVISNRFCRIMLQKHWLCSIQIDQLYNRIGKEYCFLRSRKPVVGIQEGLGSLINEIEI